MRISRLYIEGVYQNQQVLTLSKEQAHYVLTVLRLKNDFAVELFNGKGLTAKAKLIVTGRRTAEVLIESVTETNNESPLNTLLVQGISRGDRMDHSIQKAVELGVTTIQPIFTERCEVKLQGEKLAKRRSQWQTIAINACEQSGRSFVPQVLPILTFDEWLASLSDNDFGLVLDPYANQKLATLEQPQKQTAIQLLIGPEGGLTNEEVAAAQQKGLSAIQLGPRVLRTETAGPAVLAILQTIWGDF